MYAEGHVLFMRDTTLVAQPLDARRLELTGEAVPIAEDVALGGLSGRNGAFSVSKTGVLAYQTSTGSIRNELVGSIAMAQGSARSATEPTIWMWSCRPTARVRR